MTAQSQETAERTAWLEVVNSRPATWFGLEHVALLKNYVRHVVGADVVAQQLEDFSPDWLKDPEGLRRFERLRLLLREENKMVMQLARSMRLTHQARYRADKAVPTDGGGKPWESEA